MNRRVGCRPIWLLGASLWLLLWVVPASAFARLAPTPEQQRATDLITHFITHHHYKPAALDDVLSAKVLERYLKSLDPSRSYFLRKDIERFERYRYHMDETLREAQLDPAFEIFEVYQERVEARVHYANWLLERGFDFARDEQYDYDRSEASWPKDRAELDEIWRKRVKNDALAQRLAGKEDEDITEALKKRYDYLAKRTQQFNATDVYQLFLNAYTTAVEPHTAYFSPRTSENFKINMRLSLEGVGLVLQGDDEYTTVRRVVAGGPAAKSKRFEPGDRITGVGQGKRGEIVDVVGWRLDDVVDLIRGPKGSRVRLQIRKADSGPEASAEAVELVRNRIELEEQAAQSSVIEVPTERERTVRVGVVDVPTFYLDFEARARGKPDYRSTSRDVRGLLAGLLEQQVQGILVDLRGNGGGSLAEATELTGLFIKSGPVVQVRYASGRIEVNEDPDPGIAYKGPLAVLVDGHSASASEIFAGAIQDYRRGVVIGEPTFGKGTVQALYDLDRFAAEGVDGLGQLKVTIAQFFRVSGDSTQHRGVVPDIVFPTALDSEEQGERAFENALPWARVQAVGFTARTAADEILAQVRSRHQDRINADPAFGVLMEELEASRVARDKHTVTLLESRRKGERDAREKERRDRENRLRLALGLDPLSEDGDAKREGEERSGVELGDDVTDDEDVRSDVVLQEAAHILADHILLATSVAPSLRTAAQMGANIPTPTP
jgi:carboxyl-terminal processing protease